MHLSHQKKKKSLTDLISYPCFLQTTFLSVFVSTTYFFELLFQKEYIGGTGLKFSFVFLYEYYYSAGYGILASQSFPPQIF